MHLAAIEREFIRAFFYLLVFVCLAFISFFFNPNGIMVSDGNQWDLWLKDLHNPG